MQGKDLYNFLRERTKTIKVPDTFQKREWTMRCIYCGDSKKHQEKGHLQVNSESMIFHCYRCDEGGMLWRLLIDLGCEHSIVSEIKKTTPNIQVKLNKNTYDMNSYVLSHDYNISYQNGEKKIEYLKKRLGNSLIDKENFLTKFRVIPSLKQFIEHNKLSLDDVTLKKLDWIDSSFVGFGCTRGCKIICRNINDNDKYRYQVIKIKDFPDIYTLEVPSKLEQIKRNTIVLAEGIFDILNVHSKNILDLNNKVSSFSTVLNKSYTTAHRLTRIKLGLPYPKTICLLDNDMTLQKNTMNMMYSSEIMCYINSSGKDFGEENISPFLQERYKT